MPNRYGFVAAVPVWAPENQLVLSVSGRGQRAYEVMTFSSAIKSISRLPRPKWLMRCTDPW
jgi:hypothetical protein